MITKKELSIIEERAQNCAKESYEFVDNIEPERILALVGEVRKLLEENCTLSDKANHFTESSLRGIIQRLEIENARLREALEFYADTKTRSGLREALEMGLPHDCIELDAEVARAALKKAVK